MKVSQITSDYNHKYAFKSANSDIKTNKRYSDGTASYVRVGLAGLAIIGTATLISCILKQKNTPPMKAVKNSVDKIQDKIQEKIPKKTPEQLLEQRLNGRRDKRALTIYQGYAAQAKRESVVKKYLNGDFKDKPEAMPHIIRNCQELRKMVKCAS